MALIEFTDRGFYCREADVYIDPWRTVKKALITHGHSDHARPGHGQYLCAEPSVEIIRHRLGQGIQISGQPWREPVTINGVRFSFHPAGHIPGSAQIRVEHRGEVWVVTGDYKTLPDPVSEPFEPVRCHAIITESTFGLPVYHWRTSDQLGQEINQWWQETRDAGETAVLAGYSLGKAQHLLALLDPSIGPIFTHGAVDEMNRLVESLGVTLPETTHLTAELKKGDAKGALILVPPAVLGGNYLNPLRPYRTAMASGWMALRGSRRRSSVDRGFVLSDHADWEGLNWAIAESGAEKVFVTHGYSSLFSQWLCEQGYDARPVTTDYRGEEDDAALSDEKPVS